MAGKGLVKRIVFSNRDIDLTARRLLDFGG